MNIAEAVEQIVASVIHDHGLHSLVIGQSVKFSDTGMDGLDVIEVLHRTEQAFGVQIHDDAITESSRVRDLSNLVHDLRIPKNMVEASARAMMEHALWQGVYDEPQTWEGADRERDLWHERARISIDAAGVTELIEALKPFAKIAYELQTSVPYHYKNTMHWAVPYVGDIRRARAVLENLGVNLC